MDDETVREMLKELDGLVQQAGNSINSIEFRMQQGDKLARKVVQNWPALRSALSEARRDALEEAAKCVEDHWNDRWTTCNQHDQAKRSASAIRALKDAAGR